MNGQFQEVMKKVNLDMLNMQQDHLAQIVDVQELNKQEIEESITKLEGYNKILYKMLLGVNRNNNREYTTNETDYPLRVIINLQDQPYCLQLIQKNLQIMWFTEWDIMDWYYFANRFWITTNVILIAPFLISCVCRFYNQDINKNLWTDHFARFFLFVTCLFYVADICVKYTVDGADTICQKSLFVHHFGSLFIMTPLIINRHIPWWVSPIGFLHGFSVKFPELAILNYIYAVFLFVFQYGLYQHPYRDLKGYWITRIAINFVWVFIVMYLIDDCSNLLLTGPDL